MESRSCNVGCVNFKPAILDPDKGIAEYFTDGGLVYKNSAQLALAEASRIWPGMNQFILFSVGTGQPRTIKF